MWLHTLLIYYTEILFLEYLVILLTKKIYTILLTVKRINVKGVSQELRDERIGSN